MEERSVATAKAKWTSHMISLPIEFILEVCQFLVLLVTYLLRKITQIW